MATAIEIASLFATLELRDTMTSNLQSAGRQLDTFEQRLGSWGRGLQRAGAGLTALSAPLLGLGAAGIQAASGFEDVMTQLQIFGGLSGAELERVSDLALQLGADTAFSASDAAGGMLELAKAGFTVDEAMTATRAALDLAAVGSMSVTEATGGLSSALSAFGLEATDAAMVADVFAQAAQASRADVMDLFQGMETVGPVARNFGLSIEDTAAVLAVFSNNGIQGAEAGTQLRSMLLNMTRTTDSTQGAWRRLGTSLYDSSGELRDFNTVLVELDDALDQLPVEEQNALMMDLAGSYGITGFSALRASGGIDEMRAAMEEAPAASETAAAAMNTFSGRVDSLKGSVETLMITALTPFMENVLTPLADKAIGVVNAITAWVDANPELVNSLMPVIAGALLLGPALLAVGTFMTLAAPAVGALATVFGAISSPLLLLIAGVLGLGLAFDRIIKLSPAAQRNFSGMKRAVSTLITDIGDFAYALFDVGRAFVEMLDITLPSFSVFESLGNVFANIFNVIRYGALDFTDALRNITGGLSNMAQLLRWLDSLTNVDIFASLRESLTGFDLSNIRLDSLTLNIPAIASNIETRLTEFAIKVKELVGGLFGSVTAPDFTAFKNSIELGIQTAFGDISTIEFDLSGIQTSLESNMDRIVDIGLTVIGMVFGGPIGWGIAIGRLVASAIENDFLGLGTFLKESGIEGSVTSALTDLQTTIDSLIQDIFAPSGKGKSAKGEEAGLELFGQFFSFATILEGVATTFGGIVDDLLPGLQDLGVGLAGFFKNLEGADTSGLVSIAAAILAFGVGALSTLTSIAGGVLSGIGTALPEIGSAIKNFLDAISAITRGDWGGALTSLGEGVTNLGEAFLGFGAGIADGVIDAIEDLTGAELPTVEEGLAAWEGIAENIGIIFDTVKTTVETKLAELWATAQPIIQPIADFFTITLPDAIADFVTTVEGIWASVQQAFAELRAGIEAALQPILDLITGIVGGLRTITGTVVPTPAEVEAALRAGGNQAIDTSNLDPVGSRQYGGLIPRTGLYNLHQGEDVLTPQEARAFRRGGMGGVAPAYVYAYGENPYALIDKIDRARRNRGR